VITSASSSSGVGASSSGSLAGDGSAKFNAAPAGLAGFALLVNGVVQQPQTCPSDNWEFLPPPNGDGPSQCGRPCDGIRSVVLVNAGQVALAYVAALEWDTTGYVPGVSTGDSGQMAGVLEPGNQVDITSVYDAGIVTAVVGSSEPFSFLDAGKYASDEGTIPWPAGVPGSGGATQMHVAEIEVRASCGIARVVW
jgi:hypothetical protein